METLLEILKYLLPGVLVLLASLITLKSMLNNEDKKRNTELALKNQQIITPVRLQAYERLVLFMERITPANLLMRMDAQNLTIQQLQRKLLQTIRSEFDHNLTQQLYVSPKVWGLVKSAREQQTQLINSLAKKINPTESGLKLSQLLIEEYVSQENSATQVAINALKKEMHQYF